MKNAFVLFVIGLATAIAAVRFDMAAYILISGVLANVAGLTYGFLVLKKREAEMEAVENGNIPPHNRMRKSVA